MTVFAFNLTTSFLRAASSVDLPFKVPTAATLRYGADSLHCLHFDFTVTFVNLNLIELFDREMNSELIGIAQSDNRQTVTICQSSILNS